MGAWGRGLLQNDSAQDGLCEIIDSIAANALRLGRRRPGEAIAPRLGAAVGLLLQLEATWWFSAENECSARLLDALRRHQAQFEVLPKGAGALLQAVLAGKGASLAGRPGKRSRPLARALFATDVGDFPMQRAFGKREPALFQHPEAARYVQEVADRCARWAEAGFRKRSLARELSSYEGGRGIAALAVLLVLEPCQVSPDRLESWRGYFRAATAGQEESSTRPLPLHRRFRGLDDFERDYRRYLELAFQFGLQKFSAV
jgi:hypothetical protein